MEKLGLVRMDVILAGVMVFLQRCGVVAFNRGVVPRRPGKQENHGRPFISL